MIDTSIIQAVKDVGFPIVIALILVYFFIQMGKWITGFFAKMYKDNRDDFKAVIIKVEEISENFNKNVKDISSGFDSTLRFVTKENQRVMLKVINALEEVKDTQKQHTEAISSLEKKIERCPVNISK